MIIRRLLLLKFLCFFLKISDGKLLKDIKFLQKLDSENFILSNDDWNTKELVKVGVPKDKTIHIECLIARTYTEKFTSNDVNYLRAAYRENFEFPADDFQWLMFHSYICSNKFMLKTAFYLRTIYFENFKEINQASNLKASQIYLPHEDNIQRFFSDREYKLMEFHDVYYGFIENFEESQSKDFKNLVKLNEVKMLDDKETFVPKINYLLGSSGKFKVRCSLDDINEQLEVPLVKDKLLNDFKFTLSTDLNLSNIKLDTIGTLIAKIRCKPIDMSGIKDLIFYKRTSLIHLVGDDTKTYPLTYTQSFIDDLPEEVKRITGRRYRRIRIQDIDKINFIYEPKLKSKEMDILYFSQKNKPDTAEGNILTLHPTTDPDGTVTIQCEEEYFYTDISDEHQNLNVISEFNSHFYKHHVRFVRPYVGYTLSRYNCGKNENGNKLHSELIIMRYESKIGLNNAYTLRYFGVFQRTLFFHEILEDVTSDRDLSKINLIFNKMDHSNEDYLLASDHKKIEVDFNHLRKSDYGIDVVTQTKMTPFDRMILSSSSEDVSDNEPYVPPQLNLTDEPIHVPSYQKDESSKPQPNMMQKFGRWISSLLRGNAK